jgi:tetratricopeptide (TPR) repeat protein
MIPYFSCIQLSLDKGVIMLVKSQLNRQIRPHSTKPRGTSFLIKLRDLSLPTTPPVRHLSSSVSFGLAIILLCSVALHAQEGRESAEVLFNKAVILYDDRRYDEAIQVLLKAIKLHPANTAVTYYLALSLNAQGKPAEAEAYLRKGLAIDPKSPDLQYLLALTLRALGKPEEARGIAEAIQPDPASPLVRSTRDLITALRAPTRVDTPFWLDLQVRGQYDSNVPFKPNNGSLATDVGKKTSGGNLFSLSGYYRFFRSEGGRWESALTYDMVQTLNYENHNFDFNDHVVGARIDYNNTLPTGQLYYLTGRVFYDIFLLAGRKTLQRPTSALTFRLFWDEKRSNFTDLYYQLQGKLFNERPPRPPNGAGDENKNALNHRFGPVHYILFDGGRHGINLGYNYDQEDAQGRNWRYSGHRAIAGFFITLPWEVRARTNFEFHARYYPGRNTTYGEIRRDQESIALFGLERNITPSLALVFEHLWDSNHSTIPNYRIQRQVYSLGLIWRFGR